GDPGAGAVVDAVAGDADVARRGAEPAGGDDDPVPAGAARCGAAELIDRVRVDGRVGADDDARTARVDLVADDVERAAGHRRAGRDDPAAASREHLVPRDATGVEVGRAAAEVHGTLQPDDDVVLDAEPSGEDAEPLPRAGLDARPADEDVAAERDEQGDAG